MTLVRNRTVAKVDSIGFVVRRCTHATVTVFHSAMADRLLTVFNVELAAPLLLLLPILDQL
ncbi:MAG TPA: hypothetical protein VGO77_23495 [Mycobacterium sp.]|nr:hypothetical protein [Mycobacterium sp.]